MKKIILKSVSLSLIISIILTTTAFASIRRTSTVHIPPTDTKLLTEGQTYSRDTTMALQKGALLAACVVNISNAGGGDIGILADTTCHVDVDAIYVTLYLDRYNEETGKWSNKRVYQYEFTPDDTDDGKLHAKLISFRETDQEPGYYYRLWAYHEVEKNGSWETMKTGTDGVMITSTP